MSRVLTAIVLMLVAAGMAAPAESGSRAKARAWQPQAAAVKDCTRVNGRFGYYGNPWCSPAEQRAWDRGGARRAR